MGPTPLLLKRRGHHWRSVQTYSFEDRPLIGTEICGGDHNTLYGWQAGSTHPIGMLSCVFNIQSFPKLDEICNNVIRDFTIPN